MKFNLSRVHVEGASEANKIKKTATSRAYEYHEFESSELLNDETETE